MKRYSSMVIEETQIETLMEYHYTATRMTKMRLVLPNIGENVEQLELSNSTQWYSHFGKQFLSF